jgi:hypothetical protein
MTWMTATHERDQHEAFGATHNRQAHWHIESDILSAGHCPFIPTRYSLHQISYFSKYL